MALLCRSQPVLPLYISNTAVIRPSQCLQQRTFLHPAVSVVQTPINQQGVFTEALWLYLQSVGDKDPINHYVLVVQLPDGLPFHVVDTDDWLVHCTLPDSVTARFGNQRMNESHVRFTKLIYQRVRQIIGTLHLEDTREFDTWVARTNSEA